MAKNKNYIVPNSAIRRWSHICKKGNTRRPLAFTFDRVPFPVEYIRGPVEWEEMNARSLPQRPGITAENNNSSPLNFSSYLHERMSTSLLPIRECWNTSPTYSTFTDTQHCMPMQSNYMSILNEKLRDYLEIQSLAHRMLTSSGVRNKKMELVWEGRCAKGALSPPFWWVTLDGGLLSRLLIIM